MILSHIAGSASLSSVYRSCVMRRDLCSTTLALQSQSKKYIQPRDTLTLPRGFLASGVHAGIKKNGALDLGLVVSSQPTTAAACFTKNVFKAAPVQVSRNLLLNSSKYNIRSLVVNSGCANAVTGKQGMQDAEEMSVAAGNFTNKPSESGNDRAFVMSTGVIGQNLPIKRILSGIESAKASLSASVESWESLATAFMTTDTFPKLKTRSFQLGGKQVNFVGIDKGAGMIHPNMGPPHATLLGFIGTDACIEEFSLQKALTYAVDRSFNSISIDGDMSTNDTVLMMSNGASGSEKISETGTPEEYLKFRQELTEFATDLASLIVRDGEGATKFVKINVKEAPTYKGAQHIASMISRSMLVKTALHGEDANWGRILCAIGYSNPDFAVDPLTVSVSFIPADGSAELKLLINGEPEKVDEVRAKEILSMEDLEISVTLGLGQESASYYTCDLSKEYISINADYRS